MEKDTRPFAERHPKINFVIGLVLLVGLIVGGLILLRFIVEKVLQFGVYASETLSTLDTVVIVALITGSVSIVSVIVTSVMAKVIEYKQKRREYLYQKKRRAVC